MNIRQLEILSEIANCYSINKAAKNLFMTPQAASSALIALEKELGFQIMHRSRQGVYLTENGRLVLNEAQQMLEHYYQWCTIGGTNRNGGKKTITIMASPITCSFSIQALSMLVKQNEGASLKVNFLKAPRAMIRDYIEERKVDIGIYAVPNEYAETEFKLYLQSKGFQMERLFQDEYRIFVNAKSLHVQESERFFTREDLKDFSLINYHEQENSFMYPQIIPYLECGKTISFNDNLNILHFISLVENVCAFYPFVQMKVLPEEIARNIVAYPVQDFPMPTTSVLFYPGEDRISELEQRYITLIKRTAAEYF